MAVKSHLKNLLGDVPSAPATTVIVAEFPSMKAVHGWYLSPQYAEAFAFRAAAVKRQMIFVAGIDEPAD